MISDIGKLSDKNEEIRLNTLKDLIKDKPKKIENGWINLHIHTNESFSAFESPAEAVWYAYHEDVEFFGINDHYTIDGHREFEKACRIAGIKAVFSIEAPAKDNKSFENNIRYNDPDNPGRTYVVGKGITRNLNINSERYKTLNTMREALQNRNRRIVEKMNGYLDHNGYSLKLSYNDVYNLTPKGNATERHVVEAFCNMIDRSIESIDEKLATYKRLLRVDVNEATLKDTAELQTIVRSKLVKSGMPCYVEEGKKAFASVENLVRVWLEYGSVPTYPILGNPISEGEKDIEKLVDDAKSFGMYAFDLFDFRTEKSRAREVIKVASESGFPVFIGTEHNTKKMIPLVGELGKDKDFYQYFRKSAQFVYGHQILAKLCNYGYVDSEGRPRISSLKEGFDFFSHVGAMDLSKEKLFELEKLDLSERKRFFGIYPL